MSGNKNFLSKVKNRFKTAEKQEPRELDVITKEYNELRGKVADAQYSAFVYNRETERLNQVLSELSQEAAARKDLDNAKKQDGAKNEQS